MVGLSHRAPSLPEPESAMLPAPPKFLRWAPVGGVAALAAVVLGALLTLTRGPVDILPPPRGNSTPTHPPPAPEGILGKLGWGTLGVVVVLLAAWCLVWLRRRRRRRTLAAPSASPQPGQFERQLASEIEAEVLRRLGVNYEGHSGAQPS
jgi:hypothetical protein